MEDAQDLDMSKTYYYDNAEFYLTGRVAERTVKNERKRSRRRNKPDPTKPDEYIEIMVEIAPIGSLNLPGAREDTQWVKTSDLFAIRDRIETDELPE